MVEKKGEKRVLSRRYTLIPWCSLAQRTRSLDGEKLTVAPWQCSSSFIAPDPDILGETWKSTRFLSPFSPDMTSWDLWLFTKMKATLKGSITRRRIWISFQNKPSKSVFDSGRNVGLIARKHKGPALKAIMVPNLSANLYLYLAKARILFRRTSYNAQSTNMINNIQPKTTLLFLMFCCLQCLY